MKIPNKWTDCTEDIMTCHRRKKAGGLNNGSVPLSVDFSHSSHDMKQGVTSGAN